MPLLAAVLPLLFVAVLAIAPMGRLAWEGLSHSSMPQWVAGPGLSPLGVWEDAHLRFRLVWSVAQALVSVALTLALGLPVAWVLARFEFAGRRWVMAALMLPFVVPTLVAGLGILALWGPTGWGGRLLSWAGWAASVEDGPWLLLLGNLFFNLCVVVRAAADGLARVSASHVAAARTLGATPWRAFWRVEWPAIRLHVAAAACLVFLYCFSGMGLALVLGGARWATAEVEVYTLVAHELRLADASSLAVWTMGIGLLAAGLYAALSARLANPERADHVRRVSPTGLSQRLALLGALVVLTVFCLAPLLATVSAGVAQPGMLWAIYGADDTRSALVNTLAFTGSALCVALVLGGLLGWAIHPVTGCESSVVDGSIRRSVSAAWLQGVSFVPLVVSPVVVAFGLLLLYPSYTASLVLLVGAYALLAMPFVAHAVSQGLLGLPLHPVQAARTLGAGPWRVLLRVVIPALMPSLRRGLAFAAATALGEFAISLFLTRPEWMTLTTLIYQHLGRPGADNLHHAHALSVLLMLLAMGAFVAIDSGVEHA